MVPYWMEGEEQDAVQVSLRDREFWYHLGYLGLCLAGSLAHPLLYSLLLLDFVLQVSESRNGPTAQRTTEGTQPFRRKRCET